MTKKTRAQKIAASMRKASRSTDTTNSLASGSDLGRATASVPAPAERLSLRDDTASSFVKHDLRRTLAITLLVTSLLTLMTILQYKGYF